MYQDTMTAGVRGSEFTSMLRFDGILFQEFLLPFYYFTINYNIFVL